MFVEDAIADFALRVNNAEDDLGAVLRADAWTRKFVLDLYRQTAEQKPLSTQQAKYFLKVVLKYRETMLINEIGLTSVQIDTLISYPRFRREPYQSSYVPNEVRYLGDNKLGFRFKPARQTLDAIKALRDREGATPWSDASSPRFDGKNKIWVVPVTSTNLKRVMSIILRYEFKMDTDVVNYLELCEHSFRKPSTFVLDPKNGNIIVNICDDETLGAWVHHVLNGDML